MNAINAEMQKHFKITARKKLYFAIAVMFEESRGQVSEVMDALKALQEMSESEDAPPEMGKLMVGGLKKLISAIRPVYCLSNALENYKQAMGEYPEFASFLGLKDGVSFSAMSASINETVEQLQGAMDGMSKDANAPKLSIKEISFGKDFIAKCESIKIKGEA